MTLNGEEENQKLDGRIEEGGGGVITDSENE